VTSRGPTAVPRSTEVASYQSGMIDGEACRSESRKPSLFALLALGDAYCSGFRAGYFRFARHTPTALRIVADERPAASQAALPVRVR
jgi:hypothetical protein